jgi:hypothetical protein
MAMKTPVAAITMPRGPKKLMNTLSQKLKLVPTVDNMMAKGRITNIRRTTTRAATIMTRRENSSAISNPFSYFQILQGSGLK